MSEDGALLYLKFGKYSSATDYSSTAPTLVDMLPDGGRDSFGSRSPIVLARDPSHPSNRRFPGVRGPTDLSKPVTPEFIVHGLSGNNGGAITPSAATDLSQMLDVLFGIASVDPAGAATTVTGGTGSTPNLTVASGAGIPNGMVVGFSTDADGFIMRQVRSGGGTGTLVLDRTYSGTPSGTVIRLARWVFDPSVLQHAHGYFRAEWANWRRDFWAALGTGRFDLTNGQYVKLLTSWMFSGCDDVAEANPTFTEQTRGSALVSTNAAFYIGNAQLFATDISVEIGGDVRARPSFDGTNGVKGYASFKGPGTPRPKIACKLYRGTGTGEVADSTGTPSLNTLQGTGLDLGAAKTALDIAVAVGRAAAGLGYWVMRGAECVKADDIEVDGYQMIDCEFLGNSASPSSYYPLEFHLG